MSAYRPPRFSLPRYFPSGRTRTTLSARRNLHVCTTWFCPGVLWAVLAALCFLSAPNARCQEKTGGIFVRVQSPDKSSVDQATVNLFTFSGAPLRTATTVGGQAVFESLPKATYVLEVTAAGYERFRQSVELSINGDEQWVYVTLTPLGGFKSSSGPSGPPILAPNAQKELNKALESLRADKLDEARKHLEKVSRSAPSNPDVNYLWGMYYAQSKDWAHAQAYWEKAIQFYPRHEFALAALGQLALQNGDFPKAIDYLGRAVEASPSSWRHEQQLAEAYLRHNEFDQAQKHAVRAIELGKDRAGAAQLVLAKAYLRQNQPQLAQKALTALLAEQPSGPDSQQASQLLEALKHPVAASTAVAPVAAATPSVETVKPAPTTSTYIREELLPPAKWMPPDVDESMPPVESGAACPLRQIQDEVAKRVRNFVDGVNRISATEALDHEVVDRFGLTTKRETRNFTYVESLQEVKPGMYRVEEYRNGTMGLDVFPERLASLGLGSLVMIFHPAYRDEYEVTCEGLSRWHGALAWQLHFRQRADKPVRLREYTLAKQVFPVALRGRAWIATNSYQVVSLETDIVAPIPQIRLKAEHISIDYAPVKFRKGSEELWLPQSAELFFDLGGRRIHRRHHFTNYLLFSVDENQKIAAPTVDAESETSPVSEPNF
jgi:tetratricopeptide (TPR) repeat protein